MPQHIAFLRAINVGGRTVKMDALRALFSELGLANVRTFIQSGNVVFDAPGKAVALERRIEAHLLEQLGYEVETFIRSPDEVRRVDARVTAEFGAHLAAGSKLYVGFLRDLPSATNRAQTVALSNDVDVFSFGERELFWLCHKSIAETTVTGPRLAKALGTPTTTRNITSLRKLLATFVAR
jgi:uncharacterized protein (DUF1697 family)